MEIIKKSGNITPETQYKMLRSKEVEKVSDNEGYVGTIESYIIYFEDDKEIASIMFKDGKMVATNSATFIRELDALIESFGEEIPPINITSGKSKAGRTFFTAELA